tara:strand:+ start:97 stop:1152 length:1056 start_codon:yes stop_codon:yes gene_type:complete
MSKILQRPMFKQPQHEHRSTGIASGLEYREEYAVGGRVGYATDQPGGLVAGGGLENINPDLGMGNITFQNVQEILGKDSTVRDPITIDEAVAAQRKLREGLTEIPYGTAATPFETVTGAAADTLSKQFKEGEGSQLADFFVNLQRRGEERKTTRQELDAMAARDKRADELAIITGAKEDVEKDKDRLAEDKKMERDTTLTVASLANQFNIAGLNRQTAIDTARIAANALPAEMRLYNQLYDDFIKQGISPDEARARAYGTAFSEINGQINLASTLISGLTEGFNEYTKPEEREAAILKAFQLINILGGPNQLLTEEQMKNIGDLLGATEPKPGEDTGGDPSIDAVESLNLN